MRVLSEKKQSKQFSEHGQHGRTISNLLAKFVIG
jgi:hypothetical protein